MLRPHLLAFRDGGRDLFDAKLLTQVLKCRQESHLDVAVISELLCKALVSFITVVLAFQVVIVVRTMTAFGGRQPLHMASEACELFSDRYVVLRHESLLQEFIKVTWLDDIGTIHEVGFAMDCRGDRELVDSPFETVEQNPRIYVLIFRRCQDVGTAGERAFGRIRDEDSEITVAIQGCKF